MKNIFRRAFSIALLSFRDRAERAAVRAYLTRDGARSSDSILRLVRSAMQADATIERGETQVDIDLIRANMRALQ
jgi:hypothetical protein